jgi:peroxiredoxin
MKKIPQRFMFGSIFLAAVLFVGTVFGSAVLARPGVSQEAAGDFSLSSIKGSTVDFKDLKGQDTILFFFTTWCPYCRDKFSPLAKEYKAYQSHGVRLLAIDVAESQTKVASFLERKDIPFEVLLDKNGAVAQSYGVVGVPTFIFINKEGRVVYDGNDMPGDYQAYFKG